MKAVVYRSNGNPESVLRVEDIPRPRVGHTMCSSAYARRPCRARSARSSIGAFPLHEIAEALLYVERGAAKGKVVIAIDA